MLYWCRWNLINGSIHTTLYLPIYRHYFWFLLLLYSSCYSRSHGRHHHYHQSSSSTTTSTTTSGHNSSKQSFSVINVCKQYFFFCFFVFFLIFNLIYVNICCPINGNYNTMCVFIDNRNIFNFFFKVFVFSNICARDIYCLYQQSSDISNEKNIFIKTNSIAVWLNNNNNINGIKITYIGINNYTI